ncbi:MAG TPA: tRNA (adenosine(37)-N6)-threonylcarbamoyltransferase complex ATPase subunit type 1 TsaE [Burkholderiales bacterium]|nr:tRNA (adenosine(37)-N6)-threonylcarbamoyltransferase complex ATPase subunit type 1 TsaE [Burkholderiales bacterium]
MSEPLFLPDEAATRRLGAALAAGIAPGRVIFLSGELGTGKTTLVQGLLRALGFAGRVKSPTYSLVELYKLSSLNLYHFDFYRFERRSEWADSGFREYFSQDSACVVEWPERVTGLLAPPDLELRLEFSGPGRRARLTAPTAAGRDWLAAALKRWSQA